MSKMTLYEPAMCCPTGLCGVGVDPELLRISTVINNLKKNGITVERFNLTSAPQEFIKNAEINRILSEQGVNALPITVVDGKTAIAGRYPTNEEIAKLLSVDETVLGEVKKPSAKYTISSRKNGGCGCKGGCC